MLVAPLRLYPGRKGAAVSNHPNRSKRYRVHMADKGVSYWWRGGNLIPGWTRNKAQAKSFTKSAGNQFIDSPARLRNRLYVLEEITA